MFHSNLESELSNINTKYSGESKYFGQFRQNGPNDKYFSLEQFGGHLRPQDENCVQSRGDLDNHV